MKDKVTLEESYTLLFKCMMLSKRHVIDTGTRHELTAMQTMMLFLLDSPRPMNAFSKIFSCDASNITGLVDSLEQKKLAYRFEDKKDRRIKMVRLEPTGKKLRSELVQSLATRDNPLLAKLNDSELNTFTCLLQKITKQVDEV